MPSDYLSAAQKRKLNGEVKMYDISKPMSWGMFRQMPYDLQGEYLRKCVAMGAGREDMARMMGTTKTALSQYLNKYHKGKNYFAGKKQASRISFLEWWDSFVNAGGGTADSNTKESSPPSGKATVRSLTFSCEGTPKAVFDYVSSLIAGDQKYRITVSVEPSK